MKSPDLVLFFLLRPNFRSGRFPCLRPDLRLEMRLGGKSPPGASLPSLFLLVAGSESAGTLMRGSGTADMLALLVPCAGLGNRGRSSAAGGAPLSTVDGSELLEPDESVTESSLLVFPESAESESLSTSLVAAVIRRLDTAAGLAPLFFRSSDSRRGFFAIDSSALSLEPPLRSDASMWSLHSLHMLWSNMLGRCFLVEAAST